MCRLRSLVHDTFPFSLAAVLAVAALLWAVAGASAYPAQTAMITPPSSQEVLAPAHQEQVEEPYCWQEEPLADPLPVTEYVEPPTFPSKEQLRIIGRLAEGIYKVRTMKGNAPYWFCGEAYEGAEAKNLATTVAWHVVKSADEASDDRRTLNVWGWAGTLLNEGGMDLCTLGMNPRKAAYRLGILKKRKRSLSHTKDEVLEAIRHEKMKDLFSTYDLGMAQTLDIHYRKWLKWEGKYGSAEDLLEWKGLYWQATYMHGLAINYDTDRPWLYWPGRRSPWKDYRVVQHAKRLGATQEEIGPITPGDWKKPKCYPLSRCR